MIRTQSSTISLKDDLSAQVTVEAISMQPTTFLIKIKSNMNEGIQVKPSHLAIRSDHQVNASRTLFLQYKHKIEDVDKVKLKINWLTINNNDPHNYANLKSSEISQLYKEQLAKKPKQKSLILTFAHPQSKQQSIQQFRFVKQQPLVPPKDEPQPNLIQQKEISIQQEPLIQQPQGQLLSTPKQLIAFAFFSFLLGISFGIKVGQSNEFNLGWG